MPDGAMVNLTLPSVNAKFDYQVGGAYAPPSGVKVVARARDMTPASGLYNICHVNGFQIRPTTRATGRPASRSDPARRQQRAVRDPGRNELLLDIGLAERRSGDRVDHRRADSRVRAAKLPGRRDR